MKLFVVLPVILGYFSLISGEKARFDNYRVYSIEIENVEQLQLMQELENQRDGLSFMMPPTSNQSLVEILVPPHKFGDVSELCNRFKMKNEIKIENLQRYLHLK